MPRGRKPAPVPAKVGRWTVGPRVEHPKNKTNQAVYLCTCECSAQAEVSGHDLRSEASRGCRRCHMKDARRARWDKARARKASAA